MREPIDVLLELLGLGLGLKEASALLQLRLLLNLLLRLELTNALLQLRLQLSKALLKLWLKLTKSLLLQGLLRLLLVLLTLGVGIVLANAGKELLRLVRLTQLLLLL